jgi:hypothetical protein
VCRWYLVVLFAKWIVNAVTIPLLEETEVEENQCVEILGSAVHEKETSMDVNVNTDDVANIKVDEN